MMNFSTAEFRIINDVISINQLCLPQKLVGEPKRLLLISEKERNIMRKPEYMTNLPALTPLPFFSDGTKIMRKLNAAAFAVKICLLIVKWFLA